MKTLIFIGMVVMEISLEYLTLHYQSKVSQTTLPCVVTLSQFLCCFLIPIVWKPSTIRNINFSVSNLLPYAAISFIVFCATGLATAAVAFVSYPTKIVFKSIKLIPTMVISYVLLGNTHSIRDYCAALFLCCGTALFVYKPPSTTPTSVTELPYDQSLVGVVLLTCSVICDAILPNVQKRMMAVDSISVEELMMNVNMIGTLGLLFYMLVFDYRPIIDMWELVCGSKNKSTVVAFGETSDTLSHDGVVFIVVLGIVGCSLAASVLCYTKLIKESGPVIAVSIATLRKVVTIILSYTLFLKPITMREVIALLIITSGVCMEAFKTLSTNKQTAQHCSSILTKVRTFNLCGF